MDKIQKNSRQIVKARQYTSHKGYDDNLYGYLIHMSHWDGKPGSPRFLYKDQVNYTSIAGVLGTTRQTVSRNFKRMLEGAELPESEKNKSLPLIRYDKDQQKYIFIPFEPQLAMLVSDNTLIVMVSIFKQHVISTYVYLYNRWLGNKEQKFQFTYSEIKRFIGIGNSRSSDNNVTSILYGLEAVGLLKVLKVKENNKTNCYVTFMTNKLKNAPEFESDQMKNRYQKIKDA